MGRAGHEHGCAGPCGDLAEPRRCRTGRQRSHPALLPAQLGALGEGAAELQAADPDRAAYILQKLYGEQLQKQVLWTALVATAKKRGTLDLIEAEDIREIFDEIESSPVMETLWKTYQKNYSYAADISWHAIVKSICALYGSILENMYDT